MNTQPAVFPWQRTLVSLVVAIALQGLGLQTQNQRYLYIANWDSSSNSICGFSMNTSTGTLTPRPGFRIPAGSHPRHFAVHPNNKFLYVSPESSNSILVYSINPATGGLSNSRPASRSDQASCATAACWGGRTHLPGHD